MTALTAQSGSPPDSYIAATLLVSYANDPTPDPATATFTSGTTAAGDTVTLNSCSTCNWWGAGAEGAPSFVPPIGPAPASAVAIPAPTVWVGSTRGSAVEASTATDTIAITPAGYACGSSGGANTTSPGPVANCTLSQGTISGSFVMPTVTCSPCNVYVDEPNISLTQSTYAADGGTGTYNSGLAYQLVNSVESTTSISCPTCSGGGSAPTVTGVSPTNGPQSGTNTVTVSGTGFTGATAVDFGTSNPGTSIDVISSTSLTVVAPSGTGTVNVTVTTPNGTSAVNAPSDQYTYNAPPTVTGVSPTNGPQSGTNTVTVSGTGFVSGCMTVEFGSDAGSSVDVTSSTSLMVVVPAGNGGAVSVTVINTCDGENATPLANAYTYNALPTVTGVSPTNGPPGGTNTVTVSGTGFTGATAVDFGTSNPGTSIDVISSTSLTVVAPSGSGTVDVTVTTPNGTSAVNAPSDQYTYNALPTVTGVSPNNGPQSGTNTVTVSGTGFTGASAVDFGAANPGTSIDVISSTSLTVVAPSGTGTVNVTVTTPNGTSAVNAPSDQYTYNVAPTVTAVSPNNGPQSGTNTVTLTGSGFVSGSTTVDFGANAGTSVNVTSSTSLSVVVPSGTGTVSVTVSTTSGGTSAPLANAYTYNALPTVTGVSPNNGPQSGTNTVTVSGTGFTGASAVDFGAANPGTSIDVISSTSLTVVAPSGTGTVNVTVTTPNGTSAVNAPSDQYTYNVAPTVTAVSPNNGPQSGTNTVTLTGSGFVSGSTTVDFGANAGTSVNVTSSTSLSVVVPSGTGTVSVTVSTTSGGTSAPLANAYTYNALPTVTGVSPNNGPQSGTNTVTVSGTGFTGASAVDFGAANPGTSIDVISSTSLTVVAPSGTGTVNVTVTTPNGTSAVNAPSDQYTYNAPPTVTGVSPNNGPQSGTNTVTLTGSGFVSGSTTVDFGANAGTSVNVTSSTSLSVVVPSGTGTVSVTVSTTSGGTSAPLANAYTYNALPTVTGVSPNNGPQSGTNTVTVSGTGFTGASAVDFGAANPGTSIDVISSTSLTVVAPSGTGTVNVTVTTPNGTSAVNAPSDQYTYNAPPTVTGVSPNNGPQSRDQHRHADR